MEADMKKHQPDPVPSQCCAHCGQPVDDSNGGELTDRSNGDVKAYVHHRCKQQWLTAHSAASYDGLKQS